jgi:RNA polymerase sigma-70 factor (ECF subfamily)
MGEEPRPSYRQIAAGLGISEGSAQVIVHRLRRRFRDLLHDEIAQTLANPEEVGAESRFL